MTAGAIANLGVDDGRLGVAHRVLLLGLPSDVADFLAVDLEVDVLEGAQAGRGVCRAAVWLVLEHEVGLGLVLVLRVLNLVVHGDALASLVADDVHVVRVVLLAVGDAAAHGVAGLHGVAVLRGVPRAVGPVEAGVEDGVAVTFVSPGEDRLDEGAVAVLSLDSEPPPGRVGSHQTLGLRRDVPRRVEGRDAAVLWVGVGDVAQPSARRVVGDAGSCEGSEAGGGEEKLHVAGVYWVLLRLLLGDLFSSKKYCWLLFTRHKTRTKAVRSASSSSDDDDDDDDS